MPTAPIPGAVAIAAMVSARPAGPWSGAVEALPVTQASRHFPFFAPPPPPDPMQAKIFMALPFVFTVFFAFFPSGLVLYWTTNNLLSIAQQWYITRKVEQAAAHGGGGGAKKGK
jgi:membrane protein insertase Oxa1/YidC/SpoIIIJ